MKAYFLIFIVLFSCSGDVNDSITVYNFTESDLQRIPDVYETEGTTVEFQNQLQESFVLTVSDYGIYRKTGGGIGTNVQNAEYDELILRLKKNNTDCTFSTITIAKTIDGLKTWIHAYTEANPCNSYDIYSFDTTQTLEALTVGNKTYQKVVRISDVSGIVFLDTYVIDTMYYDLKEGFVGFDDNINDIQFRILN